MTRLFPPAWYGGRTAYHLLYGIREELRQCSRPEAAVGVVESYRPELYDILRERFDVPRAQALALKALNTCLARCRLSARAVHVPSRPIRLTAGPDDAPAALSPERFARLLKLYGPYAIEVCFCDDGLNPGTPRLIRAARRCLLRTTLSSSLSGERFDAEACVESGLDLVAAEIDGASRPFCERSRRGSLELALGNLRRLVEARRRLRRTTPILCWNFLALEHNEHELAASLRLAREIGVDQFRVVRPFETQVERLHRVHWASPVGSAENGNVPPDAVDEGAIARAFENPWETPFPETPIEQGGACCGAEAGGIRSYFHAADSSLFDGRSLALLADGWEKRTAGTHSSKSPPSDSASCA